MADMYGGWRMGRLRTIAVLVAHTALTVAVRIPTIGCKPLWQWWLNGKMATSTGAERDAIADDSGCMTLD